MEHVLLPVPCYAPSLSFVSCALLSYHVYYRPAFPFHTGLLRHVTLFSCHVMPRIPYLLAFVPRYATYSLPSRTSTSTFLTVYVYFYDTYDVFFLLYIRWLVKTTVASDLVLRADNSYRVALIPKV